MDPFHGAVRNMTTDVEITSNVTNGLLSARQYGTERIENFMEKRFLSRGINFYDTTQYSTKVTLWKKRKRER